MHEPASGRSTIGPRILARDCERAHDLLTSEALGFLTYLARSFHGRVAQALAYREKLRARLAAGERLDFLTETAPIRSAEWTVATVPEELRRAAIEMPGPPEQSAVAAARAAGADVFIADFEDRLVPAWESVLAAHAAFKDALREDRPLVMLRPRSLSKIEQNVTVDGRPIPAFLFDLGLALFHGAKERVRKGSKFYVVVPKIENHLEARVWNDVFVNAEGRLDLSRGSIRAVVRIERFPAIFEADEILYKLCEYAAALAFGHGGYVQSALELAPPDIATIPGPRAFALRQPMLQRAAEHVAGVSRRRGARAVGCLSREVPVRWEVQKHAGAIEAFREGKTIEANLGFQATWVSHPAFVPIARAILASRRDGPNARPVNASELYAGPVGAPDEASVREVVRTLLVMNDARAQGIGCAAVSGRSEDLGSAEGLRSLVAQWTRRQIPLEDGRALTPDLVRRFANEEAQTLSVARPAPRAGAAHSPEPVAP